MKQAYVTFSWIYEFESVEMFRSIFPQLEPRAKTPDANTT
jgi:hypothetical protein